MNYSVFQTLLILIALSPATLLLPVAMAGVTYPQCQNRHDYPEYYDSNDCEAGSVPEFLQSLRKATATVVLGSQDFPPECTLASLRNGTANGLKFGRCTQPGNEFTQERNVCNLKRELDCSLDPPCISITYHKLVHESFIAAARCAGVTPKEIFPVFAHESRMHPNAVSGTGALGGPQLTSISVAEVNRLTKDLKTLALSPQCAPIADAIGAPVSGEYPGARKCSLVDPPHGPVRAFVYGSVLYRHYREQASKKLQTWLNGNPHFRKDSGARLKATWLATFHAYNGGNSEVYAQLLNFLKEKANAKLTLDEFKIRFAKYLEKHYLEGRLNAEIKKINKEKKTSKEFKRAAKAEVQKDILSQRKEKRSYASKVLCDLSLIQKDAGMACSPSLLTHWAGKNETSCSGEGKTADLPVPPEKAPSGISAILKGIEKVTQDKAPAVRGTEQSSKKTTAAKKDTKKKTGKKTKKENKASKSKPKPKPKRASLDFLKSWSLIPSAFAIGSQETEDELPDELEIDVHENFPLFQQLDAELDGLTQQAKTLTKKQRMETMDHLRQLVQKRLRAVPVIHNEQERRYRLAVLRLENLLETLPEDLTSRSCKDFKNSVYSGMGARTQDVALPLEVERLLGLWDVVCDQP